MVGGINNDFALARYNQNGTLDTSFGNGGIVTINFDHGNTEEEQFYSGTVLADGKILVSGVTDIDGGNFALARFNANGALDTSFGVNGIVSTDITGNHNYDDGVNLSMQSDGKILIAGGTWSEITNDYYTSDFVIVRYNSNGTLDTSFGSNGKVISDFGGIEEARKVITLSDSKILVVGVSNNDFALARYNQNGTLDTSFGNNGKVISDFGSNELAWNAVIQSDNKILVSGFIYPGEGQIESISLFPTNVTGDFIVARYNADGLLDTSFGNGGKVITEVGGTDFATDITLQTDGKILVTGQSNGDFALVRYNSDGTLDASFDGVSSDATAPALISATPTDAATSVPVSSDITLTFSEAIQFGAGNIVISNGTDDVRTIDVNDITQIAISGNTLTINPTADLAKGTHYFVTLDAGSIEDLVGDAYAGTTSYNFTTRVGGVITTDFGGNDFGFSMAIQSDGKILMTGTSSGDFALARYNQNGSLDTTFSGDGKVTTDIGTYDLGFSVTVLSDGKILLSGISNGDFVLLRYHSGGSLDTSFSGDGKVITDFGGDDGGLSLIVQSDGKILVGGFTATNGDGDFALVRYNPDGNLDTSFSTDGKVITDIGDDDYGFGMVVQGDGKILVAGSTWLGNESCDFVMVRYNSDGSLDSSFSGGGIITTNINYRDQGIGIALQNDGKIIVVGESDGDFAVVRYNTNGSLDKTFSGEGIVTTNIGNYDSASSVTVQADGKILVAGFANGGTDQLFNIQPDGTILFGDQSCDFALVRYNTDGTLDTGFGSGGKVITDFDE